MAQKYLDIQLLRYDDEGVSLSDLVYHTILDAMFQNKLKAGDMVSEFSLSKVLGVSRTPIHLAVRDLMNDGLIEQHGKQRPHIAKIGRQDLNEIFEMRTLLECEATRRAATRMGREQISKLTENLEEVRRDKSDEGLSNWSKFDDEFHEAIARASGHDRLYKDIMRYRRIHYALNSIRMRMDLVPQALNEHQAILDGLAKRDPERASKAMATHLIEWQAYYSGQFPIGG